jgi:phage recombination protein Bet
MDEAELVGVLATSIYPGAQASSIKLAIGYCRASGLDPLQKPVHIVPMWDSKAGQMRDVIMPGVGLYRTQAARTGQLAGVSEPDFGPDITETIGGVQITFPAWCKIIVKRQLHTGTIAEFSAVERWKENYAVKGGKEKSIAPNAMWAKRPYGQIAKCAQAQALRIAFPELGGAYTAEEMEGKALSDDVTQDTPKVTAPPELVARAEAAAEAGTQRYAEFWKGLSVAERKAIGSDAHNALKQSASKAEEKTVDEVVE